MVRASRATPVAVVVGLLASGALVWSSSYATFTSTTSTGTNSFTSGRVTIDNSSPTSALFAVAGLVPGSTGTQCVDATYRGDVAASVKLYATYGASDALAPHLDVTVDEIAPGAACTTGAASTAALHGGTGDARLSALVADHHDFATGLGTWSPAPGEVRRYRVSYVLRDEDAAQGRSAQVRLTWEARNT